MTTHLIMKYLCHEDCGLRLFFVRLSEAEVDTIEAITDWMINNSALIESIEDCTGGATVEELEQMRDIVRFVMLKHLRKQDLPEKAAQ